MALITNRVRRLLLLVSFPIAIFITIIVLRTDSLPPNIEDKVPHEITGEPAGYDPKAKPKPLHLPEPLKPPPIQDNFPLAARAKSSSDLPAIPSWNLPPRRHSKHPTPLFIGFTRNWRLLQQTVVSYLVAGWPASDIYVVENTGTMHSNKDGKLTLQNPFFLDHHRLTKILGINVLITPTLLTFAQLQNFFVWTAVEKGWDHYFWAHMDTVMVSDEEYKEKDGEGYKSAYMRALEAMEMTMDEDWGPLATLWFHYDHLALVRTQAFLDVGGWDTLIPFYVTDCDMHERLWMKNFKIENAKAGKIWDVAGTLDDLALLYRRGEVEKMADEKDKEKAEEKDKPADEKEKAKEEEKEPKVKRKAKDAPEKNSPAYKDLLEKLDHLQTAKSSNVAGRNTWQASQKGGQGEPFYRDSDGFEKGLLAWMDFGREIFAKKWGRGECNVRDVGLVYEDQWRMIEGWEKEEVQRQYWRDKEREEKERKKAEKLEKQGKEER